MISLEPSSGLNNPSSLSNLWGYSVFQALFSSYTHHMSLSLWAFWILLERGTYKSMLQLLLCALLSSMISTSESLWLFQMHYCLQVVWFCNSYCSPLTEKWEIIHRPEKSSTFLCAPFTGTGHSLLFAGDLIHPWSPLGVTQPEQLSTFLSSWHFIQKIISPLHSPSRSPPFICLHPIYLSLLLIWKHSAVKGPPKIVTCISVLKPYPVSIKITII